MKDIDEKKTLGEHISALWRLLFGRTTIVFLLIAVQLFIIFGGMEILGSKMLVINNIFGIVSILIMFYIMNLNQNSSFKLMWIIIVVAAPIIGVTLYIFTKLQPGTIKIKRRLEDELEEQTEYLIPPTEVIDKIEEEAGNEYGLFKYIYEDGFYPPHSDYGIKYFPLGEDKFEEMIKQIEQAKEFIFMEYFIIDRGEFWGTILSLLIEKAAEGVEVRLMYDGTNSMFTLPKGYHKKLKQFGIECRVFAPIKPFLSTHQNNRDHRKILVIDGHTAFTGGVNLADEYINEIERFGHWKDTAVMVKGKVTDNFTMMFLSMWNIKSTEQENYSKYLYHGGGEDDTLHRGGYMTAFGDSPYDDEPVGKKVYMDILNKASDYVHIMTPYLILDEEFINALTFAAQRGVDVKLILPHIPDKMYAYLLARTHFVELISRGVKIYEYTPGFVHAKVFTSDDIKAVVGTINLDFRSLYLHFEDGVYVWNNPVVKDVEEDFQNTLAKCQRITMHNCDYFPVTKKIAGRVLRLIAPLM